MQVFLKLIFKIIFFFLALFFSSCTLFYNKCDYCNLTYKGEKIVLSDNLENSFHYKCFETYLNPDRKRIVSHRRTGITKSTDITPYFNDVRAELINIGFNIREDVIIQILDKAELMKRGHKSWVRGFTAGKHVFIENGFDELTFKGILAHELVHVWQGQNKMLHQMTKINIEGLAELAQAQIHKMDTTRNVKRTFIPNFYHKPKWIPKYQRPYVLGHRKMKRYLDEYGWEKLIEGITMFY